MASAISLFVSMAPLPVTSGSSWHSISRRDLADYFGSIPHSDLLKSVARRIVDRRVLHLIKMWLDCPVEETDDRGRKTRTTEARDKRRGIPQGSPLSPLLANIYMPVCAGVEEARP
jgi:retron-type reverse transcriptase